MVTDPDPNPRTANPNPPLPELGNAPIPGAANRIHQIRVPAQLD